MLLSAKVQNFKAIKECKDIKFIRFNAFIGNNGCGKSSFIEGLQLLQDIMNDNNFTNVFKKWGGLEKIRNKESEIQSLEVSPQKKKSLEKNKLGIERSHLPIEIKIKAKINKNTYDYEIHLNTSIDGYYVNEYEFLKVNKDIIYEDAPGYKKTNGIHQINTEIVKLKYNENPFCKELLNFIQSWYFLNLNAHIIGNPILLDKTKFDKKLKPDGSNLSEIIKQEFKTKEELKNIIEKLKFIIPYTTDIQTTITTDIVDQIFIELTENNKFKVPSWLLSTGTLRILAFLMVLNKKETPSVLFIEEIENGLDPRTIGFLLSEIQSNLDTCQFIVTTHSIYFLDLLDLSHIIFVEKNNNGSIFKKPNDLKSLQDWKDEYSPGQLYIKGKFQ